MARPAYVDIPDSDLEQDDPAKTGVMIQLRDNALAGRITIFGPELVETDSVTLGGGADVWVDHPDPITVHIPDVADYTGIQRLIRARFQAKTAAGATGTYRLKDSASGNTGAEVTTTSATYVQLSTTLDVLAAWKGTDRLIIPQLKSSSGTNTAYLLHNLGVDWYLEY